MMIKCPECEFTRSESIKCPNCRKAWMEYVPESSPGWLDVREELLKWVEANTIEVNNVRGRYTNYQFSAVSSERLKKKINELLPPGTDKSKNDLSDYEY